MPATARGESATNLRLARKGEDVLSSAVARWDNLTARPPFDCGELADAPVSAPFDCSELADAPVSAPFDCGELGDATLRAPFDCGELGDATVRAPFGCGELIDATRQAPFDCSGPGSVRAPRPHSRSPGTAAVHHHPRAGRDADEHQLAIPRPEDEHRETVILERRQRHGGCTDPEEERVWADWVHSRAHSHDSPDTTGGTRQPSQGRGTPLSPTRLAVTMATAAVW